MHISIKRIYFLLFCLVMILFARVSFSAEVNIRCDYVDPHGTVFKNVMLSTTGTWQNSNPVGAIFLPNVYYQDMVNRCTVAVLSQNPYATLSEFVTAKSYHVSHDLYFHNHYVYTQYPVKRVVVFGDSLSDNSNAYRYYARILKTFNPGIEWNKRFSNGFVWADWLTLPHITLYGLPDGGRGMALPLSNYAIGGALSKGKRSYVIPGLDGQMGSYLDFIGQEHLQQEMGQSLYVFLIGANDFLSTERHPDTVAQNLLSQIHRLLNVMVNAKIPQIYLVVPKFPDVSVVVNPKYRDRLPRVHQDVIKYNRDLDFLLNTLVQQYAHLIRIILIRPPLDQYLSEVVTHATLYGLDAKSTCMHGKLIGSTVCNDPKRVMFWDGTHLNATVNCVLGKKVTDYIEQQLGFNPSYHFQHDETQLFRSCWYSYIAPTALLASVLGGNAP